MKAHILIAEDDDNMRDILAHALRRVGYDVTTAPNGSGALELLTRAPDSRPHFDVVLTDIMMGEIDGIEVMNVARQQATPPEVILLTGQSSVETAIAAVRAGAFDYMIKPCLVPRLLARVAEAVDQHRTRQQVLAHASAEQAVGEPEPVAPAPDAPAAPTAPAEAAEAAEADRYLSVGQLRIDTYRREVCFAQEPLHITPTEYTILVELAARPERVVGYSELAFATHGVDLDASEAHDLLRHHVRNLRRKLAAGYLVGVRSTGYMLDPQD